MSFVPMPNRRAAAAWPSSCNATQPKTANKTAILKPAPAAPIEPRSDRSTNNGNSQNVQWMDTRMPIGRPSVRFPNIKAPPQAEPEKGSTYGLFASHGENLHET